MGVWIYVVYVSDDGEVRLPPEGFPSEWKPGQQLRDLVTLPDPDDMPALSLRVVEPGEVLRARPLQTRRFQAVKVWVEEPLSSGDLLHFARRLEERGELRRY